MVKREVGHGGRPRGLNEKSIIPRLPASKPGTDSTLDEDPMEGEEKATASNAHAKALAINLDASIYGSFAEIGAGQEVAQWFLRVGAASGTVAQTICAYDKAFSDDRYGKGTRYVSRERLLAMLEREYTLVSHELGATRGATTRFFSFADTVAGRNFKGDNDQHGWLGIRFEADPRGAPSDILLHVELRDPTATAAERVARDSGREPHRCSVPPPWFVY